MGIPPTEDKGSLGKIVRLERKRFLESPLARPLVEKDKGSLKEILRIFLECIYIYHDEAPKDLEPSEFRRVVLETLPRRFSGEEKYLSSVPKAVSAYIDYLKKETTLTDPDGFENVLVEMEKKFTKIVKKIKPKDRIVDEEAVGQIKTESDKVGRNDPCPCGSGKKYKKCCMGK